MGTLEIMTSRRVTAILLEKRKAITVEPMGIGWHKNVLCKDIPNIHLAFHQQESLFLVGLVTIKCRCIMV